MEGDKYKLPLTSAINRYLRYLNYSSKQSYEKILTTPCHD